MAEKQAVPFSMDAEEAVLGSVLLNAECICDIIDILEPKDFFHERTALIYRMMLNLSSRGEGIDIVTISHELDRIGESSLTQYVMHLIDTTPTYYDIEHYAGIVRRCSVYRQLLNAAGQIASVATEQDPNVKASLDKCEGILQELRQKSATDSRRLVLGKPRLIQTNPPRYIWNVNDKDLRLTLSEITQWGKFKNKVISELNFVPIRPKDWDNTINTLITHSLPIEAPADASEEQQLKIFIQKWFGRMREANVYSDLSVGRHVLKEIGGITYYFFQSTPLVDYLRKEYRRGMNSEDLWVCIHKWSGIRHKIRVKTPSGSMPADLWGIPIDFVEEKASAPSWF